VSQMVSTTGLRFQHRDFAETTSPAGLGDLVIYDCPFPEFSVSIPSALQSDFELVTNGGWFKVDDPAAVLDQCRAQSKMKGGGHYGGDEGGDLQLRILKDAALRVKKGASVVICNYATPTLLVWYKKMSMALYQGDVPIFLFKRPQKDDQLYCLAIWPSDQVLARTRRSARQYVEDRIQAIYAEISNAMGGSAMVQKAQLGLLLQKHWK
jgi:hypothetical protein